MARASLNITCCSAICDTMITPRRNLMVDHRPASPGHGSALIGFRPGPYGTSVSRGYVCLPLAVPDRRSSTLKEIEFNLTRLQSHTLMFGKAFTCLSSLWERPRLRPALSPPLSPKKLRRWNSIERHRAQRIGIMELPASTQKEHRPRTAKGSIR